MNIPLPNLANQLLTDIVNSSFYAILRPGVVVLFDLLNVVNLAHGVFTMLSVERVPLRCIYKFDQPAGTLGKSTILLFPAPFSSYASSPFDADRWVSISFANCRRTTHL